MAERTHFMDDRPFEHHARNGAVFVANRCDLRGGVTVKIPRELPELPTDRTGLMQGTAEMIGYHSTNILPNLNAFQGYDAIEFTIEVEAPPSMFDC